MEEETDWMMWVSSYKNLGIWYNFVEQLIPAYFFLNIYLFGCAES